MTAWRTVPRRARTAALLAALCALSACVSLARPERDGATAPPNIVLIVAEDLSPRIGAYGDGVARTPNIDRLADEGLMFTRVFATSGVCAPSRAALITGMYQESIGAQHMRTSDATPAYRTVPAPHVKAFPEYLRAAGYVTLNNAKTDYQFGEPFTVWDRSGYDVTLDDRDPGRPFFLMLSHPSTHESSLFRPERALATNGAAEQALQRDERFGPDFVFTDIADVTVPAYLPDTPGVRTDIARQYDNVALLDQWVGEVVGDLRRRRLLDNTVLIFTTDHGDGLPRAKRSLYDAGLHVPFIIRFPDGRHAGERRGALMSLVDLAPTVLALAGAPEPSHWHGEDMLSEGAQPRERVFAARDRLDDLPDRSRAVRDERFKYIRNFVADRPLLGRLPYRENLRSMQSLRALDMRGELGAAFAAYLRPTRPGEELYDLANDPDETRNLADAPEYAAALARLRDALAGHMDAIGDMGELGESDMAEAFWPGGVQPHTAPPDIDVRMTGEGSAMVTLTSATAGASIGYRLCGRDGCGEEEPWRLYTGAVQAGPGVMSVETKAVRYGYAESLVRQRALFAGG